MSVCSLLNCVHMPVRFCVRPSISLFYHLSVHPLIGLLALRDCVCLGICVCVYIYIYICIYVCMYVCMIYMYVCMYVCVYVCMYR